MSETKLITKTDEEFQPTRKQAQKLTFAQLNELIQRNVSKTLSKSYTQYAKESVKNYVQNPSNNLDNIREVSRFLERNSTLYRKILTYYASTPLFYYNLTQLNDYTKSVNSSKIIKDYQNVSKQVHGFNIKKEGFTAIYNTVRDGMYVGFSYTDDTHTFLMPLDIKYCRIYGKNSAGQWIVYFNAAFFSGDNVAYVEGLNGDTAGVWDKCFVDGYQAYQNDRNAQWFRLTPERTFCMIAGSDDQFDVPLPLMSGLFISLMDLSDMEQIIADKTELENYKLLVSKIPLIQGSDEIDDFAVSIDLIQNMQALIDAAVPDLVGTAISPMDLDVISFDKSNNTDNTDKLSQSVQNLFNNAGVSQIVVAGGMSSNSVGLKHALQNDTANIWVYVNRFESWLNFYITQNLSEDYVLSMHPVTWYNRDDYIKEAKESATLGGDPLHYLTALGDTPYIAWQKLNFSNALGIRNLMIPLKTSYTDSANNGEGGREEKDVTDLSPEGVKTRDKDKNGSENN